MGAPDATPFTTDAPVKSDVKVVYETGPATSHAAPWSLWTIIGTLTASIALAIASLTAHSGGWFTYKAQNWTYYLFKLLPKTAPPQPFTLKFWIGYVRGTSSLRKHMHSIAHIPAWRYLREGGMIAQVVGGAEAALLGISIIAALVVIVMSVVALLRRSGRLQPGKLAFLGNGPNMTLLMIFSSLFSAALGILTVLFYAMMAIGVKRESKVELDQDNIIIWPDWAWWLTIIVVAFWGLIAGIASRERIAARLASATGKGGAA
eukprot:jgi/Botrbrau1/17662/Bobra.0166s0089.1